jgi:hypothetical protein
MDHTLHEFIIGGPPIILVHQKEEGIGFAIDLANLDPTSNNPTLFGILLSDLLDHITHAYHLTTGRDERDIRASITKVMRDEDRFKEKDPGRCGMKGAMIGR